MAIEAAKQTKNENLIIRGFNIKDVIFQNALTIPLVDDGIETQFYLRNSDSRGNTFHKFHLYGLKNGEWLEICNGNIQVDYQDAENAGDGGKQASENSDFYKAMYQERSKTCSKAVDTQQMYRCLQNCGLDYGPTFQRLTGIACNDEGEAIGQLVPFEWLSDQDTNYAQPHVVHPTTLDSIFQLTFAAISKGGDDQVPTMIPTKIQNCWISNIGLRPGNTANLYTKAQQGGRRKEAFVLGLDSVDGHPRLIIEGLEATVVAENRNTLQPGSSETPTCFNIDWKPDLRLLNRQQTLSYCLKAKVPDPEPVEFFKDLQLLVLVYISNTVVYLAKRTSEDLAPHFQQYTAWLRAQLERFHNGTLPHFLPQWSYLLHDKDYQVELSHRVEETCVQGKFYVEIGKNLSGIFEGKVDPLAILFQGDLAKEYYREIANSVTFKQPLASYLDALVHQNPGMKILEVGAGTGGMTSFVIDVLMHHGVNEAGTPRYSRYDYTDLSRSFFHSAQESFRDQGQRMKFNALNIADDPVTQGFDEGTYDLVVAASVN